MNKEQQGFSILEILIALFLITMVFLAIPSKDPEQLHNKLEEAVDSIDRAVRFASNEAILRNAIVRLKMDLSKEPIEYAVEFGPNDNLTLPEIKDTSRMSLREKEKQDEVFNKIDSQFNKVEEFSDITLAFPDNITIIGAATSYQAQLLKQTQIYVYFYPTGERDSAIIFFSSYLEMATLEILPFQDKTKARYYTYSQSELANLEDSSENKMNELFLLWQKK